MDTTMIMFIAGGAVGLLVFILSLVYFINRFGFFRRGNKLMKAQIRSQASNPNKRINGR